MRTQWKVDERAAAAMKLREDVNRCVREVGAKERQGRTARDRRHVDLRPRAEGQPERGDPGEAAEDDRPRRDLRGPQRSSG